MPPRIPLIAGNWKMFKTVQEAVVFVKELRPRVKDIGDVEIVVAPPFTAIHAAAEAARNTNIAIAAQNVHWEAQGAFTGEIGPPLLKEAGAEYVIIGHSERRQYFGETDESVNRKVRAVLAHGLAPIVCVGETLAQRDAGETFAVLDRQVAAGLSGLSPEQITALVIAYEPVWAIGTGRNATPEQADAAHARIRGHLRHRFGVDAAEQCHILYGGSVKPDNVAALMAQAEVDGALVGGASLDVESFVEIISRSRPPA